MNIKTRINSFDEYKEYLKAFLFFFDDFCRKNSIKYSVLAGTMLGTIRDKGLIPWDGDVDVALTRAELDKLKMAFKDYKGRYHLNYPSNFYKKRSVEEQHPFYCRIIDKKCPCPYFLIDVFTFDFLGNDLESAKKGIKKLSKLSKLSVFGSMFHLPAIKKNKSIIKKLIAFVCHIFHPIFYPISWALTPLFFYKISKCENEYFCFGESSKYATVESTFGRFGVEENILLNKGFSDYCFENFKVMCINNYDFYLKKVYGDYLTLPPIEKQVPYPSCLLNTKYKIIIDDELNNYLISVNSFLAKK